MMPRFMSCSFKCLWDIVLIGIVLWDIFCLPVPCHSTEQGSTNYRLFNIVSAFYQPWESVAILWYHMACI